jgi:peptidoglycan/xylan/chitin deacetylase (PgdA/CDA1 family)
MFKYRWVKAPSWLKALAPRPLIWDIHEPGAPTVYITFDDGPHPEITPFVLDTLAQYDAKATFFCIGHNVVKYPDTYKSILAAGHKTGNHTYNHLNGTKTENDTYFRNIDDAAGVIRSTMFRPPYGLITPGQVKHLTKERPPWKIVMWDIISYDFDRTITPEQCAAYVLRHIRPGSIIVFHDSEKAWERMKYALPKTLDYCREKGWALKVIPH